MVQMWQQRGSLKLKKDYLSIPIIILPLLMIFFNGIQGQDIMFPTERSYPRLRTSESEIPNLVDSNETTSPCPVNMTLYSDENNTHYCDCSVGYLYYPPQDSCYLPYTRGPCPKRKYLVISKDDTISRCKRNPCHQEGLVQFENKCYTLFDRCNDSMTLVVNEDTLQLECTQIHIVPYQLIVAPLRPCAAGSRRIASGACRMIL